MVRLRRLLPQLTLCSALMIQSAFAQSASTQVQDTVYYPNGQIFNGKLVITWIASQTQQSGAAPTPYDKSVKIYNGVFSVSLVPSAVTPPTYYKAAYTSSDGLVTWSEIWQVPASATPLTLSAIRVTNPTNPGSGGSPQIPINEVTGLGATLSSINGSLSALTSNFNSISSSVAALSNSVTALTSLVNNQGTGNANVDFVDAEVPSGPVNGTNLSFTLAKAPLSPSDLKLYRNGLLLTIGTDFTLNGNVINFLPNAVPDSGDTLLAYYSIAAAGPGQAQSSVDSEIPGGAIDGMNLTFTLTAAPNPALSLKLYKNGILLQQNSDYTLKGASITFANTGVTPAPGDLLTASYRVMNGNSGASAVGQGKAAPAIHPK